ncbi:MAG: N-acetylmuramoyl-L-alanine amidase [Cryomorphaceae bacterium]|nr:N-acetylmuramoyl-L-alanine amidase [Flavobacteriales bacterium]
MRRKNVLSFLLIFLIGMFIASSVPKGERDSAKTVIVIDAGHGGKDPGNLGTGRYKVTEKTIALNVSLKVGAYIENAFENVEVLYTRDSDNFIPLHERTKFANTKEADIFVSIHCDAFTRESASGCGSYVMGPAKTEANLRMAQKENQAILLEENREENYGDFDPNSPEGLIELSLRQNAHIHQSLKFAKLVQDQMRTRVGRKDRGVRQAPYWVISFTTMPSVLVELGFLTNKEEEDFLNSEQGQDYVASAIYRAFKDYKNNLDKVESAVEKTEKKPEDEDDKKDEEAGETVEEANSEVVFKVQLSSASSPVELKPENFNGLENVTEYRDNDMYKYLYGSASTYEGAKNLQKAARKKGFRGAFVVAFDGNNSRMTLEKAIELNTKNQ